MQEIGVKNIGILKKLWDTSGVIPEAKTMVFELISVVNMWGIGRFARVERQSGQNAVNSLA